MLPLIGLCGALLGAAECFYHRSGPPPIGHPRHDGASWLGIIGLQALLFLLPALLALLAKMAVRAGFSRPRSGASSSGLFLCWVAALFPTLWVDLDHLARFSHWPLLSYYHETLFAWETLGLACVAALCAGVVAVVLSRGWLRFSARMYLGLPLLAGLGVVLVVLIGAALLSLGVPSSPRSSRVAPADAPNLLLFTIDTLRPDALGSYGGPATPGFDEWIGEGVRCEGFSCAPWTRPSFASLFSGVAPTGHGANRERGVSPEVSWWPQVLQEQGWQTRAYVSNPHLEAGLGFGRGFDHFDHAGRLESLEPVEQMIWVRTLHRKLQERLERGDRIIHKAVKWLNRGEAGPWMVWVHVIDPHMPYHLRGAHGETTDPHPGPWLDPLKPYLIRGAVRNLRVIRGAAQSLGPLGEAALRELYQREIFFLDRQVLALLHAAQIGSGDRPLLWVLASDHGEEFFEHGGFEHGHTLYGELLRVPLVFGGNGLPEGATAKGMKLEDVGPTVLSLLGLPAMQPKGRALAAVDSILAPYVFGVDRSAELQRAGQVEGENADPETETETGCSPPALLAEDLLYGTQRTRFLFEGGEGILRDDELLTFSRIDACGPMAEVDVPLEASELSARERTLLDALDRWRHEASKIPHEIIDDPALRERLRSLGYVN